MSSAAPPETGKIARQREECISLFLGASRVRLNGLCRFGVQLSLQYQRVNIVLWNADLLNGLVIILIMKFGRCLQEQSHEFLRLPFPHFLLSPFLLLSPITLSP